jgi:hypothetical protein
MEFEDVLSVLLGWTGREIEVGTHGANGAQPVSALEVRGILRRPDPEEVGDALAGIDLLAPEAGSFRLLAVSSANHSSRCIRRLRNFR